MKKILILILLLVLSGCAHDIIYKPEINKDKMAYRRVFDESGELYNTGIPHIKDKIDR